MGRYDAYNQLSTRISSGGSLSPAVDTEGWQLAGMMVIPAGTSVVAGSISFQVSVDNVTFMPLNDSTNTLISIPHSTSKVAFSEAAIHAITPYRYVRVLDSATQPTGMTVTFPVKLI